MQARTVLNQLQEHLHTLFANTQTTRGSRSSIWLPRPPTFSQSDKAYVQRWRLYLKWEEGNPLEIEEKDRATLLQRIQSVYRKAVVRMRYYSEIWWVMAALERSYAPTLTHISAGTWPTRGRTASVRQRKRTRS